MYEYIDGATATVKTSAQLYQTAVQTGVQTTLSASLEEVLAHSREIKGILGLDNASKREELCEDVIGRIVENIGELNNNLLSIKQKLERL